MWGGFYPLPRWFVTDPKEHLTVRDTQDAELQSWKGDVDGTLPLRPSATSNAAPA